MEGPATTPKVKTRKVPKKFAGVTVPAGAPPAYGLRAKGGSPGQGTASKASRVLPAPTTTPELTQPVAQPALTEPAPIVRNPFAGARKRQKRNPFGGSL